MFSPKLSKMSLEKLKEVFEIHDGEQIRTADLPVSFLKYSQSRTILSSYQTQHANSLSEEDAKLLEGTIQSHNLIQLDPKPSYTSSIAEKRHNPIVAKTQKFYEAISRQLDQMDTDDKRAQHVQKLQKRLEYERLATSERS